MHLGTKRIFLLAPKQQRGRFGIIGNSLQNKTEKALHDLRLILNSSIKFASQQAMITHGSKWQLINANAVSSNSNNKTNNKDTNWALNYHNCTLSQQQQEQQQKRTPMCTMLQVIDFCHNKDIFAL